MAGEGGGKPVLKIPVDSSEWDAFIDSYQHYNATLEKQGDAWASSNRGIREQKTAFDSVEKIFEKLVKAATDPKFSNQSSGVFVRLRKDSAETEKSWRTISRDLEKSAKSMGGLARSGLSFNSLGLFGGALGLAGAIAGGAFAGVRSADDDLANQNLLNRKLGLKPGEEKAFGNVYEKVGADSDFLAKIATAKANQSDWRYLQAAGVSVQDIQAKDPAELAQEFLQKASAKYKAMGAQGGLWAEGTGVSKIAGIQTLNAASSYNAADYADFAKQFQKLVPQLAAQQKTLDEATGARQQIEADLAKNELELDKALIKLNPMVISAADGITEWVTAFANSGELERDIKAVGSAFEDVATVFEKGRDVLNHLFGLDKPDAHKGPSAEKGGPGDRALSTLFGSGYSSGFSYGPHDAPHAGGSDAWDYYKNLLFGSGSSSPPPTPGMDTLLDATREVESSNGKNLTGPVTAEGWRARGPYQFSPADLARYGVTDPDNEQQERAAAARKYADLKKRYGDNAHEFEAAYAWGEGNIDKYLKKHGGQWGEGDLPASVKDYLVKMDKAQAARQSNPFENASIEQYTAAEEHAKATDDRQNGGGMALAYAVDPAKQAKADYDGWQANLAAAHARIDKLKASVSGTLSEGGGSQYRSPDAPRTPSTQMAPYNINVTVTPLAGSSTTVTAGGLAQ
ncbi:lytic transglycosylase domain-containing protein [Paraburkholderia bryophila]|uniref:Transglycosylase-like protein with SLT domain n=1 Tax=Paraburkholderia bryophila TaxID=420952 RepID=A0A7Y9W3L9_9BURK|nr:lytic transglycosylase domain-containing protein [Paraburkholderia bryophila]NYH13554.1 hypothetical protein [Paraburkholderia bryophila]